MTPTAKIKADIQTRLEAQASKMGMRARDIRHLCMRAGLKQLEGKQGITIESTAKRETVTIEIPKEVFESFDAFVQIAGIKHTTQELIIQDIERQVEQSVESTSPSGLNGICDWLLAGYDHGTEDEKELVRHELFAEVRRQRPEADILPFHQSPRELVEA
jgi:hypothetical protein